MRREHLDSVFFDHICGIYGNRNPGEGDGIGCKYRARRAARSEHIRRSVPMAEVKQDLYGLEYSANFSISGLQV